MVTFESELQRIVEDLNTSDNKKILLRNYVKEVNSSRVKEGRATIVVDVNLPPYDALLRESINVMNTVTSEHMSYLAEKYKVDLDEVIKQKDAVIESLRKSLDNFDNSTSEKDDKYKYFGKGIKVKKDDGTIYITGRKIEEQTIIKEEYKKVNSRVATLIKDEFRNNLPNKLQMFKIQPKDFYKIQVV